jgi:hypothetical protein
MKFGSELVVGGSYSVPTLVERCRRFEERLKPVTFGLWITLGLADSIRPEDERRVATGEEVDRGRS